MIRFSIAIYNRIHVRTIPTWRHAGARHVLLLTVPVQF